MSSVNLNPGIEKEGLSDLTFHNEQHSSVAHGAPWRNIPEHPQAASARILGQDRVLLEAAQASASTC
jgi:hypothetical protein